MLVPEWTDVSAVVIFKPVKVSFRPSRTDPRFWRELGQKIVFSLVPSGTHFKTEASAISLTFFPSGFKVSTEVSGTVNTDTHNCTGDAVVVSDKAEGLAAEAVTRPWIAFTIWTDNVDTK